MARKQRKDAYLITHQGEIRSITEWSRITGISRSTIRIRLERLGWDVTRAFTEKPQARDTSQTNSGLSANERRKRRRHVRRKKGLCIYCKKPADGFHACADCRRHRNDYEQSNKQKFKQLRKNFQRKQKRLVFEHYGTACECCGESHLEFLTLDHPNDDGSEQRSKVGAGGRFYHWLVKNDFPVDYELRTLCFNCNQGRRVNGGVCPHKVIQC